jgi:hypothetical protein
VRKHDERYPRHERDTDEKGSQNKGLSWVGIWVKQLLNGWTSWSCAVIRSLSVRLQCRGVPHGVPEQSSYDEVSGNNVYIVGISPIAQNQTTESTRNFNLKLMTLLEKATQNFQVSYLWVITAYSQVHESERMDLGRESINDFLVEEDKNFQESDIEDLVDELPAFSSEDAIYDEERQQQLELEMEKLLTEPGDDGFSFLDKSILRKDSPIPEWYGDYDLTLEELEQGKMVRYIPGIGWFVDE